MSNTSPGAAFDGTAVDLFCGAGGLSEGLGQAGFRILVAADHDPDGAATYQLNHPGTAFIHGDLTDGRKRQAVIDRVAEGRLDLLAGGPPCQAFSQIHNHDRLLADPRNRLYREFVELVDDLRPRALLLENVPGMNQVADGAVRRQVESDLSLGGSYDVVSGVLDACDFGVPQRRPRLVFIGLERGCGLPELPFGTGLSKVLRSAPGGDPDRSPSPEAPLLASALRDPADIRAVTAEQAISDLIEPGEEYPSDPDSAFQALMRRGSKGPQDHVPSRTRADTIRRLEAIPPGGNVHDLPADLLRRYIGGTRWGPAGNGQRLARRHYYAYRRLHPDRVAWTVNTKADFAYHYGPARGLSVREAARLQGFPDRYHFTTAPPGTPGQYKNGARHSRYRQVGNAVPPPLAKAVGERIAAFLAAAPAEQLAA